MTSHTAVPEVSPAPAHKPQTGLRPLELLP
jgi:hypothetical protein